MNYRILTFSSTMAGTFLDVFGDAVQSHRRIVEHRLITKDVSKDATGFI